MVVPFQRSFFKDSELLNYFVSSCDVIIHLAGVNRADSNEDAYFHPRPNSWGWATWEDRWNSVNWEVDENYFRPAEVEILWGDPSKAEKELNWKRRVTFQELVSEMVQYDLKYDDFRGSA